MDIFILLSVVQQGCIGFLRIQFFLAEVCICNEIYKESVLRVEFTSLAIKGEATGVIDLVSVIIYSLSLTVVCICLEDEHIKAVDVRFRVIIGNRLCARRVKMKDDRLVHRHFNHLLLKTGDSRQKHR